MKTFEGSCCSIDSGVSLTWQLQETEDKTSYMDADVSLLILTRRSFVERRGDASGVCGLSVRFDLESRTAGNYNNNNVAFLIACLLISVVWGEMGSHVHVGLLWLLFTAAGG